MRVRRESCVEFFLANTNNQVTLQVWSYAMLCLELLTDNVPYPNRKADVHVALDIIKGVLPARPGEPAASRGLNDNMWRIMTACWNMVPAERPTMSQVRNALRELQEGAC